MEDLKSLVTKKPTTNEQLEKPQNSSQQLSKRQAAIAGLIQRTQTRRGLPLISAGWELSNALSAWQDALKAVPDDCLSRCYERAAENWPWTDGKAFTADAVADAYKLLLVEDRQRAEADSRNALRRNAGVDTYKCHHCLDVGYQLVFSYRLKRWYSSFRACCCDLAPAGERNEKAVAPPEFVRNKLGEYARQSDLEKFGAPSKAFEKFITAKEGE